MNERSSSYTEGIVLCYGFIRRNMEMEFAEIMVIGGKMIILTCALIV